MVRPLSNDLRKRAVAAVAKGESCRSVALRFGVAVSSVVKWSLRYRTTSSTLHARCHLRNAETRGIRPLMRPKLRAAILAGMGQRHRDEH